MPPRQRDCGVAPTSMTRCAQSPPVVRGLPHPEPQVPRVRQEVPRLWGDKPLLRLDQWIPFTQSRGARSMARNGALSSSRPKISSFPKAKVLLSSHPLLLLCLGCSLPSTFWAPRGLRVLIRLSWTIITTMTEAWQSTAELSPAVVTVVALVNKRAAA